MYLLYNVRVCMCMCSYSVWMMYDYMRMALIFYFCCIWMCECVNVVWCACTLFSAACALYHADGVHVCCVFCVYLCNVIVLCIVCIVDVVCTPYFDTMDMVRTMIWCRLFAVGKIKYTWDENIRLQLDMQHRTKTTTYFYYQLSLQFSLL